MECLLPYLCMVTVPHIMVRLERMLDYRGVGLVRFHCRQSFNVLSCHVVLKSISNCVRTILKMERQKGFSSSDPKGQ